MARVLEIPEEFKQVGDAMAAALDVLKLQVERGRRGSGRYADFEMNATDAAAALERAMHGVALAALDVDASRLQIDGVEHLRVGRA